MLMINNLLSVLKIQKLNVSLNTNTKSFGYSAIETFSILQIVGKILDQRLLEDFRIKKQFNCLNQCVLIRHKPDVLG